LQLTKDAIHPKVENDPEAYGELTSFEIGGHIPMALLMIVPLAQECGRIQAP